MVQNSKNQIGGSIKLGEKAGEKTGAMLLKMILAGSTSQIGGQEKLIEKEG